MSRFPRCRLCHEEHRLGLCPSFFTEPSRVTSKAAVVAEVVWKGVLRTAQRAKRVVANSVANDVANRLERPARKPAMGERAVHGPAAARGTSTERVRRWRATNRAKYNAAQRERMREKRAARRVSG